MSAAFPREIKGPEGWDSEHRERGFHFLLHCPMEICEPVRPKQRVLAAETMVGNWGTHAPPGPEEPRGPGENSKAGSQRGVADLERPLESENLLEFPDQCVLSHKHSHFSASNFLSGNLSSGHDLR